MILLILLLFYAEVENALHGGRIVAGRCDALTCAELCECLVLLAAERLGFLPTAAIMVAALCAWLGVRLWAALLIGVLTALVVQWFFGSLMRVPLPRGWFMQLVAGG
jgi:hypothetical protein